MSRIQAYLIRKKKKATAQQASAPYNELHGALALKS